MNQIQKMQEMHAQALREFKSRCFVFDPALGDEWLAQMSVSELQDLGELQLGESTYLFDIGDTTRTA